MIQGIVGQGGGLTVVGAAGHVAPGVVACCIVLGAWCGAGWTVGLWREGGHLMGMGAIAVQVLFRRACVGQWALPELAEIGVGVAVGEAASQGLLEGCRA